MSFLSRFVFRLHPQIFQKNLINNTLNLTTSVPLYVKFGKLINDHVTSAFYLPIGEDGSDMAVILYDNQNGLLNLHHTEVPQDMEGKNIGRVIAKEVFEYCSARNLKLLLSCDFLVKFYEENPQYKDLVVVREKMDI